jgi:hypothetical protein
LRVQRFVEPSGLVVEFAQSCLHGCLARCLTCANPHAGRKTGRGTADGGQFAMRGAGDQTQQAEDCG